MNTYHIPFRETEDDIIVNIGHKLNLLDSDIFIDVGCGNGVVIEQIKKMYPNVECIGIELNNSYYMEAVQRLSSHHKVRLIQADLRTFDWSTIPGERKYYYLAWTKTYLNEFNFNLLQHSTLIIFKHQLPNKKYYDMIRSTVPYNNVYFYNN
jgi:16S rRNA A1518/A1519 N6-dimethyltransferase RsmA/KsgA/DIM1 with predicted DNA glycosylase/AP lyase activity